MKTLRRAAELIAAALFAAMFGAFLVQVFTRYVLNHPVAWSSEACSLAYIWIVFWSAAALVSERQHIGFDLLYKAQPPARRRLLAIFITASIFIVFVAGAARQLRLCELPPPQDHVPAHPDGAGL